MKVTDHIAAAQGKTLFSFEILPPVKGTSIDGLFQNIERLMQFDPKFIDVTSHREEFIYKKHPNGLLQKVHTRKRPGTVGISTWTPFRTFCAAALPRRKRNTP